MENSKQRVEHDDIVTKLWGSEKFLWRTFASLLHQRRRTGRWHGDHIGGAGRAQVSGISTELEKRGEWLLYPRNKCVFGRLV